MLNEDDFIDIIDIEQQQIRHDSMIPKIKLQKFVFRNIAEPNSLIP